MPATNARYNADVRGAARESLVYVKLSSVPHCVEEKPEYNSDRGSRDIFCRQRFQVRYQIESDVNRDESCANDSC